MLHGENSIHHSQMMWLFRLIAVLADAVFYQKLWLDTGYGFLLVEKLKRYGCMRFNLGAV